MNQDLELEEEEVALLDNRSHGSFEEENFGDLQAGLADNRISIIVQSFLTDCFVYACIIAIYFYYVGETKCGIPITAWLIVHISLFMANSIARLVMVLVIRHFSTWRVYYNIVSTMFINCMIVAWLIYGNILYYSEDNDCMEKPETKS